MYNFQSLLQDENAGPPIVPWLFKDVKMATVEHETKDSQSLL